MKNKYPLKQAIITGMISGIFAVFSFSIINSWNRQQAWGINPATIRGLIGLVTLLILGAGIYVAMQSIKKLNGGKLLYGQAIKAGIFVGIITGLIMALWGFIYCEYINPGYATYMVNEGKRALAASGQTPQQVENSVPDLQKQYSTGGQIIQAIVGQSVCGIVISLIMGLFVRTKNK